MRSLNLVLVLAVQGIAAVGVSAAGKADSQDGQAQRRPPVVALSCSPDSRQILAAGQFGVEIYDVAAGQGDAEQSAVTELRQPVHRLDVEMPNVHSIAFSPDGKLLAIGGGAPSDGGIVELYSWPDLERRVQVQPHQDIVYGMAWSPDGKYLATVSYDRDVKILDATDGGEVRKLSGHSRPVLSVAWLSDGETLLTAGVDRSLRVWQTSSGKLSRSLENHTQTIHALAVRPQQDETARPMIATAGADKSIRFWQPTIGRMVRFARLESAPLGLAWTADGGLAIAACEDGKLRGINPDTASVEFSVDVSNARLQSLAIAGGEGSSKEMAYAGDANGRLFRVRLTGSEDD